MTTGPPRLLLDGLHFGEGPRWHDGRLYLSDFYDHAVKAVTMDGEVTTVVEVPDPAVRARLAARRPDARRLDGRPQGPAARAGRPGRARRPLGHRHVPLQRHGRRRARPRLRRELRLRPRRLRGRARSAGRAGRAGSAAGDPRPGRPRRQRARGGRRPAVPERRGDHARRLDDDRGGDDGPPADARSTSRPTARSRTSGCGRRSTAGCPTASASTPRAGCGSPTRPRPSASSSPAVTAARARSWR